VIIDFGFVGVERSGVVFLRFQGILAHFHLSWLRDPYYLLLGVPGEIRKED
jgi:hypothetical protein